MRQMRQIRGDVPAQTFLPAPGAVSSALLPASVAGPSLTLPEVTRTLARWPAPGKEHGPSRNGNPGGGRGVACRPPGTGEAAPPWAHPANQPWRHCCPSCLRPFLPGVLVTPGRKPHPGFPLFLQKVSFCQRDTHIQMGAALPRPAPPLLGANCLPTGVWVWGASLSPPLRETGHCH